MITAVQVKLKFDTYTTGAALVIVGLGHDNRYWELWQACGHINLHQRDTENVGRCECKK